MNKKVIWLGCFVGSTVGGCLPGLWHASMFSLWGIALSTIGGVAGIWLVWRMSR